MKRLTVIIIVLAIIGGAIMILFNNRSKMAAKMRRPQISTYAVSVARISKQKLNNSLTVVGTIGANNDVTIVSEISGRIKSVQKKINDYVTVGTVLIQVEDEIPQARLLSAKNNYDKAQRDLVRSEGLLKDGLISNTQLETAQQVFQAADADYTVARRNLKNAGVTTPISGEITDLPVNVGMMLNPGTVIADVLDISTLKLKLNVAERDVFQLQTGDPVVVTTDIYPGVQFPGTILSISQKGDDGHTYPVQVRLTNNKQSPLKAGMFAQATFQLKTAQFGIMIPRTALVADTATNPQVYVVANGIAKLRDLVLGAEVGAAMIVQQGLSEGETIVTQGQTNLIDGAAVKIANQQ